MRQKSGWMDRVYGQAGAMIVCALGCIAGMPAGAQAQQVDYIFTCEYNSANGALPGAFADLGADSRCRVRVRASVEDVVSVECGMDAACFETPTSTYQREFYFFDEQNSDLIVRVLEAPVMGAQWIFATSMADDYVEVQVPGGEPVNPDAGVQVADAITSAVLDPESIWNDGDMPTSPATLEPASFSTAQIAVDAFSERGDSILTFWSVVAFEIRPVCAGDTNADGTTGLGDLLNVLSEWGSDGAAGSDLNLSGSVGLDDLLDVLSNWGNEC